MSGGDLLALIVGVAITIYLVVTLLLPERFS